nr:hypothetical protein [Tanacetum cinerariifolium]
MSTNPTIIAEKLYPTTLTNIQLFLIEDMLETFVVGLYGYLRPIQAYDITLPLCINTQPSPKPDASQYTTKSSGPSGSARTGEVMEWSWEVVGYGGVARKEGEEAVA